MATSFHQFSIPPGIQSGAGAQRVGHGANQTGNLLNMLNASIQTPEHLVHVTSTNGHVKRRFGSTTKQGGHAYDYPVHNVAATGNGQSYPMSKPGYLPGNNGGGQAGYGIERDPAHWTPAADVTEAQEIAFRAGDYQSGFVNAEHFHYVDRTKETLQEQFANMAEDYTREHIKDLLAKGFSEEEVAAQLEREREKRIEQAKLQPYNQNALMRATLAKAMPTVEKEDFMNQSVSPGLVPLKNNLSAHQIAVGQGNKVARQKAAQAMNMRERLAGRVSNVNVEKEVRKVPMSESEILKDIMEASRRQHTQRAEQALTEEKQVIDHQKLRAQHQRLQENAMRAAFSKSINDGARNSDPQHPAGEDDKRGQYY